MIMIRVINTVVRGVLEEDTLPPLPDFVVAELDWLDEDPSTVESATTRRSASQPCSSGCEPPRMTP